MDKKSKEDKRVMGTLRMKRRSSMQLGSTLRPPSALIDTRRSSDTNKYICKPCQDSGNKTEATNFCSHCHVYLCTACHTGHNAKNKRSHSMPQGKYQHNNVTYNCMKHKSKAIQYFCMGHNILGCQDCVAISHRSCAQVRTIPEMIQHMEQCTVTEEQDELLGNLSNALKHAQKNKTGLTEKETVIEETRTRAVNKVRELRRDMNALFDTVEEEVEVQAGRMRDRDIEKVREQSQEYDYIITNIENLIAELHKNKENHGQELFIAMKTTETNIELIKEKLRELEGDNLISQYDFVLDREVRRLVHGKATLGSVQKEREAAFSVDICIKTSKDTSTCWVSGVVAISSECVVVADHENSCIKMVNTLTNKVKSQLQLPASPWDMARIEDKYLAVTLPDEKRILILKIKTKLIISQVLQVDSECCGIDYADQKLYVTFNSPASVQVLNLQGRVLQTISTDQRGQPLFTNPFNIVTSPDKKFIYVSDVNEHSVTCLTMEGHLVNVYKSFSLTGPMGLVADMFGNVYVCGGWSNTIHRLKPDCSDGKVILRNMSEPQSITIGGDQKKFYVGKLASNRIGVYDID